MSSTRSAFRLAAVWGLGLAYALPAGAQTPLPKGADFQVNTYTTDFQHNPAVAADAHGNFVVVWSSQGSSGTDTGYSDSVQAQRFASNGSAQGAQFQVNTFTTDLQREPSVAAAANGNFVVVWESGGSFGTDTFYFSIQGQRYSSNGAPQGLEFQVNTYTTQSQIHPWVAAAPNGDFVVVWESEGSSETDTSDDSVQGQRYASNGTTQGGQFQVNTYTTSDQQNPSVSVAADGDFVVAWQSYGSSGTDSTSISVQGQRYASDGLAQGGQFQVNTYTTSGQILPSVAAASDGDFVVVWSSAGSFGSDTSILSVQGQRYASSGATQGGQFQVNTFTPDVQLLPAVAATADDGFIVTWESFGSPGNDSSYESIQGQRYAANGSAMGMQFQVNTYTPSQQTTPAVAAPACGDFVVVWWSIGSSGTDSSGTSVQARCYRALIMAPAMSSATRFALGAALLLLGGTYAVRRRDQASQTKGTKNA
jgi:hypothetical protein